MSDILQLSMNLIMSALSLVTDLEGIYAPIFICLFVSMIIWQLRRILYDI